jgi:hypothetical protein
MKRLFTFGCSFTQYWRWPTWADALGRQYEHFENWGLCGAGNSYIFYSLLECHYRNLITSQDSVYIMWTNTSREDRYVNNRWLEGGNIYWVAGSDLGQDYIRRFACERGYLIRDLAVIAAVKNLLDHWGCQYEFLSMVPLIKSNLENGLGNNPVDSVRDNNDVTTLYQDVLSGIHPSVLDVVFLGDWNSRPGIPDKEQYRQRDFHPTPLEHVEYLEKVLPETLHTESIAWMSQVDNAIRQSTMTWSESNRPLGRL